MKKYILCGIFVTIVSVFSVIDAKEAYYENCDCVAAYKRLCNKSKLSSKEEDKKKELEECPCVKDYIKDQEKNKDRDDDKKKESREDDKDDKDRDGRDDKDGKDKKNEEDSRDKDKKDDKKNDDNEKEKSRDKEDEDRAVDKAKDAYEDTKNKKKEALKRKSRGKEDEKESSDKDREEDKKKDDDKDSKKSEKDKEAFNYLNSMPAQQLEKIINGLSSHGVLMTAEAETKEEPKEEKSALLPKKYRINKKNSKKLIKELDKYRKIYS